MAILKWNNAASCSPARTAVSKEAIPYYGAGTVPPRLTPAWLHDRGGAGGPMNLLGPKDVGVGQYLERWTYSFYANGVLIAAYGPYTRSHTLGVLALLQAFNSWKSYVPNRFVCADYVNLTTGAYGRICTFDGVNAELLPPPPNAIPPHYFIRRATTIITSPVQQIIRRSVFSPNQQNLVLPPQRFVFPTPITNPTFVVLRGPHGTVGQNECADLQAALANAQYAYKSASDDLAQLDTDRINAAAAGDDATVAAIEANRPSYQAAKNAAQANVNSIQSQLANCQAQPPPGGGGAPPGPTPLPAGFCSDTSPCPDPNQECVVGICLDKCPTGYVRSSTDQSCVSSAQGAGISGGAGLAWLLGIGAAVAAIFLGMRAPKLPKQPARARHARAQRARRREAA